MLRVFVSTLFLFGVAAGLIPHYHFPIEGILICEHASVPLLAIIEVWEQDTVTSDDHIATANLTGANTFTALFDHSELGQVSPYLIIYHTCHERAANVTDKAACFSKTVYPIEGHEEKDLGETVRLKIDLRSRAFNTTLICDPDAYPFNGVTAHGEETNDVSIEEEKEDEDEGLAAANSTTSPAAAPSTTTSRASTASTEKPATKKSPPRRNYRPVD